MCFLIALGILGYNYSQGITEITPGLFFWSIMYIAETQVELKKQVAVSADWLGKQFMKGNKKC